MPLDRVVFGLGIRHVGSGSARILAAKYNSFEAMAAADVEELESTDEIGSTIAAAVIKFFSDETGSELITKLACAGVGMAQSDTERVAQSFEGMAIVITGTLEKYTREEAADLIRVRGGKVTSSVSKRTTFVLSGANPGSKVDKAQKIGIKIINESTFDQLMA